MAATRFVTVCISLSIMAMLAACSGAGDAPESTTVPVDTAPAASTPVSSTPAASTPAASTSPSVVPDLSDPKFWTRNAQGKVMVTPDNFVRAESDLYMAGQVKDGAFGKFKHTRTPVPLDQQNIIRLNRDTIYSSAILDLDAGPAELTLPESNGRFLSAILINQDHFNPAVYYKAGTYQITKENVGTRYVMVGIRIFADPNDPEDMKQANALQDAVRLSQPGGPGSFKIPEFDMASQTKVRDALLVLSTTLPDLRYAAGPDKASVDPVRHLIAAASGWGLNPDEDAIYLNVYPEHNDGKTAYTLTVGDVPVDAFWSVSVYNAEGYFEPNKLNAYVVNSVTGTKNDRGSIVIQFGDCTASTPNCLPITKGWNYTVRLYRPRAEILDGSWTFPAPQLK